MEENKKFTEDDFDEEELMLLKLSYDLIEKVADRIDNGGSFYSNTLFSLVNKLGVYDIVSSY